MGTNLPLQIQRLGGLSEQVLVLLHIAELQSATRTASPAQVKALFHTLRLPPPANVSEYLKRLAKRKLAISLGGSHWAVTPEGRESIADRMSGVSPEQFSGVDVPQREPTFGEQPHHLIPPELAPASFQEGIGRFLQGHPFDSNVFCMTRFPRAAADPVAIGIAACRAACADVGLELHLASDRTVEDLLFGNIAAAMWACRYGIAIFEDHAGKGLNHNLAIEVGGMLMTGRRCLLLKDPTVPNMPTDLVGHIYQAVDIANSARVGDVVNTWAHEL